MSDPRVPALARELLDAFDTGANVPIPPSARDGGIDLDTVASVSEEISRGLDLRDPIPGRYTLEVSTPGLERNLRSPGHFARSVGRRAVIKTHEVVGGNTHRLDGIIAAADDSAVTIDTAAGPVAVPYEQVKSARTIFDWK
jgi:ribosome maturation factor RimP